MEMAAFLDGLGWAGSSGLGQGRKERFSWGEGALPTISRKHVFSDPQPHFGRMDTYSKLGVAAIALALRDAGIERRERPSPIALIASSVHGCIETDYAFYDTVHREGAQFASPHLFAYTVANTFLGEAAIQFHLTGPTFILNEGELTGRTCLLTALSMITTGESGCVVAGICDLGAPPFLPRFDAKPGALFVVLSATAGDRPSYGRLRSDGRSLYFEQKEIKDLVGLAARLSEVRL
jgi:3-oxoacyl-[acyl-carrier-protein] synthase II